MLLKYNFYFYFPTSCYTRRIRVSLCFVTYSTAQILSFSSLARILWLSFAIHARAQHPPTRLFYIVPHFGHIALYAEGKKRKQQQKEETHETEPFAIYGTYSTYTVQHIVHRLYA